MTKETPPQKPEVPNFPIYEDKEGNVKIQIFKNVNKKGVKYVIYKLWLYKFPFKFNRNITLNRVELEKLGRLLPRLPVIEEDKPEKKEGKEGAKTE
jgi:hypothetical protein